MASGSASTWPPAHALRLYLERLGHTGSRRPEFATLKRLHRAHLEQVPFENLDVSLGRPIHVDQAAFFDKIVLARRGGFCYELNGLFAWLLGELGFEVRVLSARVFAERGLTPEFAHMLLVVGRDPGWVVDVGFGDSFVDPLPFTEGTWAQSGWLYRLAKQEGLWRLARRRGEGDWEDQYLFAETVHPLAAFEEMCQYTQQSSESHFTHNTLCTRVTETGRITLSKLRLTTKRDGEPIVKEVADAEEYDRILRQRFGIALEAAEIACLLERIREQSAR